jgi:Anti-sigma-28 factor, FlgM
MDTDQRAGVPNPPTPHPPTTNEGNRVTQLKQQLAVGDYRVNADAVAREMLFKLQLASLSRRALVSYSTGQSGQLHSARHHC